MTHEGTFVQAPPQAGEATSPLIGEGSIEVSSSGLRIRGSVRRARLVGVLSGIAAVVTMLALLIAGVLIGEELRWDLAPKLMAAMGMGGLLGGYLVTSALLDRVVPPRTFDHVVRFAYLVSGRERDGAAQLICTDPACAGRFTFRTANPRGLLAEVEAARPK